MNGLEHGVAVANVGASGSAHAALKLGGLVGDDIAVEVGQEDDLELFPQGLFEKVCSHDINVVVLHGDIRVVLCHLMGNGGEFAVGLFHNVSLGDDGNMVLAVLFGVFKGCPGDPPGAQIGGHLEIHCHTGKLHTLAAQNILALGVLPVEHPFNVLFGDADRAAVGVQIQLPAHGHVGRLHGAAVGGGGGAFQQHIAGFDFLQHCRGDGLAAGHAVFNGQTVDLPQNNRAGFDFLCQQLCQHMVGVGGDDGADAVSVNHTDDHLLFGGKVCLFCAHVGNSGHLLLQNLFKGFTCHSDILHYCPPSLV